MRFGQRARRENAHVPDASVTGTVEPVAAADTLNPERIRWVRNLPFIVLQLGCLLVLWTGVSNTAVVVGLVTLFARMFGLTAGYHRYFCHRAFKTSRAFQFVLGWLGGRGRAARAALVGGAPPLAPPSLRHRAGRPPAGGQGDGLGARRLDHGPRGNDRTRMEWIRDFARFRELRWLDAHHYVAPIGLGVALFGLGNWLSVAYPELGTSGAQLVVVGFFCSTTLLYHVTFAVNSIGHCFGSRRYETNDASRNSFWLALVTGGEGWHNNHHRYPASERQGFLLVGGRPDPLRRRAAVVDRCGVGRPGAVGRRHSRRRALTRHIPGQSRSANTGAWSDAVWPSFFLRYSRSISTCRTRDTAAAVPSSRSIRSPRPR